MPIATGVEDEDDRDRWLWENRISRYFAEPDELRKPGQPGQPEPAGQRSRTDNRGRDARAFAHFNAQATRSKRLALAGGLMFVAFTFGAIVFPIGSLEFFALLTVALTGWGVLFYGLLRWKLYRGLVRLGQKLEVHLQVAGTR